MATGKTVTFALKLDDQTSGAANQAAGALGNLKKTIEDDVKALREMQKAMRNFKGDTAVSEATIKGLQDRITAQKAGIAQAQGKFVDLGGSFDVVAGKADIVSGKTKTLSEAFASAGKGTSGLAAKFTSLGAALFNPLTAILAVAAAMTAFAVATVGAFAALARFALVSSSTRREESLRLEGLVSLREQYGRTTASVNDMQAAIDRASDSTGLGRAQLEGYTRGLTRMGLTGEALTQTLEGMGLAASVQGERGAQRFRAMAVNAALTGRSIRDVTEEYRRRLGPQARRVMLSLDNQSARLRRGLERIFSGLRIETFLSAISQITDLFSQSTIEGRALKAAVEAIFQPMFDATESLGPILRRFFQGILIGILGLTIGFLTVRNAMRRAFGDSTLLTNQQLMTAAMWAGVAAVGVFVLVLAAFLVVIGAVALVIAGFVLFAASFPAILFAIVAGFVALNNAVIDFFSGTDFVAAASNMVTGLINGLVVGTSRLQAAMVRMAQAGIRSFQAAFGISSPSSVFAGFGMNITEGLAQGIERGSPAAGDAVSGLIDAPVGGARIGATSIAIGDVNINAGDSANARELAIAFRDELANVLEGVSIELGAT